MIILHLIPSFGSGGAERQLSIIAPALAESGVECHIGYCSDGPNLLKMIGSSVHLHQFQAVGNHDPRLFWQIFSLIRVVKPDVVQTWLLQMDVLGGMAALLNAVPFIISERASAEAYHSGWKNGLRILLGKHAACIIANSSGGLEYWRSCIPDVRLHLVRNCVSPMQMGLEDPLLEKIMPIIAAREIVLFAGRFSYEKNISVLVESMIIVALQQPNVVILLFGEGPERDSAERKITDAGLSDRMLIVGYSLYLAQWMRRASVCVSVSYFEGHPNVVIEAASVGCPLVLSDIPAHRELFGDESVFFVPADSAKQIAAVVVQVLFNKTEAHKRAARARVETTQWTVSAATKGYSSIYEKLVNVSQ